MIELLALLLGDEGGNRVIKAYDKLGAKPIEQETFRYRNV